MAGPHGVPSRKSPRTLSDLVQSLPQELYDQIYEETFDWKPSSQNTQPQWLEQAQEKYEGRFRWTPCSQSRPRGIFGEYLDGIPHQKPYTIITIDGHSNFEHPPMSLLRVNRATRSKVLRAFYENTRFVFASVPPGDVSSKPDAMSMRTSKFETGSVECTLFNDRLTPEVRGYLHPFGLSLRSKGLCSNIELVGKEFRNHPVMWEHDAKIHVWGL